MNTIHQVGYFSVSRLVSLSFSVTVVLSAVIVLTGIRSAYSADSLPIADAHIHYSHDSVELTPPERVIEIMREAQLKFALVSSSDDRGTQLLANLAPDLIVPGLRPYSRRGQLTTWYSDQENLEYVEKLLEQNRYASIGEFHLYGDTANLEIPRRIVELAVEHNLILHVHSDALAVEWLLKHSSTVKVLWAHAGFEDPEYVSEMLSTHDRLWVDLAFRSEVGLGGTLSREWRDLFAAHPDKIMLGTDTYTPERIHYVGDNAESARVWLKTLPAELAEKIAWKNAYDLIMPVWTSNRSASLSNDNNLQDAATASTCRAALDNGGVTALHKPLTVIQAPGKIKVSEPFDVMVSVCGDGVGKTEIVLDATMPAHGHGINYTPQHRVVSRSDTSVQIKVDGMRLHMPGGWQWNVNLLNNEQRLTGRYAFQL